MTAGAPAHRHGEVDTIFNVSARLLIDGLARRTSPIPTEPRAPAGKIRACLARLPAWCLPRSLPHVGPHRQTDADARLCLARQAEPSAADTTATWCSSSQPSPASPPPPPSCPSRPSPSRPSPSCPPRSSPHGPRSPPRGRLVLHHRSSVTLSLCARAAAERRRPGRARFRARAGPGGGVCSRVRACLCWAGRAPWCKPACASGASQRTPAERACGRAWSARAEAA
jgi:hypothetical protein